MTVWRWAGSVVAALVAAGGLGLAAAGSAARAGATAGGMQGVGGAGKPSGAADALVRAGTAGRADAGLTAREVLQGEDFWWKRVERVTVPTSGILGFFATVAEFIGRLFKPLWDLFVEFLRGIYQWWRSLYGWLATGDWTGGSDVIWLIAAVILGWAIWKLSPFVVRWIGGLGARRARSRNRA